MSLAILGVNHKTAPIELREKIAFNPESIDRALYHLSQHPLLGGCVILSTCNRTEIYLSFEQISDLDRVKKATEKWLCQYHGIELAEYSDSLYWYTDKEAVDHLMRVACGIDSLVIGEPQIFGQVKQAFSYAQENGTACVELSKWFQRVFNVAKRIRTETKIGANTASVAYTACTVARQIFSEAHQLNVMLVGAGETIELISRYLRQHGFNKIIIANRTREKALKLAVNIDAEIISLPEIAHRLKDVDIVISSTASPLPIIGKGMVERTLQARNNQEMLFIDLAVPRDVEAEVADLAHIHLYTVDDLQSIISTNLEQRAVAAQEAEYIIQEESEQFMLWLKSRTAIELIKEYRQQAQLIKQQLEDKALHAIEQGADVNEVIRLLSHRLTNRLIHAPTVTLSYAASQECECLTLLSDSLGLNEP
ncbi:glutamyl-tRNA reductase [Zophobihabitans entericus]|uniref:Glutamyl-tRNA reductase n=1 Tax=Zophobihabitans entericus TaxID=1635327 RepID=A0A6G9IE54_9GAMM|nr:glutamyl-tRNA reductase [Zophobihabitans entericus]QIQ22107.1 glutamyl-tRNA reductase [Zophobihabitans entericus]